MMSRGRFIMATSSCMTGVPGKKKTKDRGTYTVTFKPKFKFECPKKVELGSI